MADEKKTVDTVTSGEIDQVSIDAIHAKKVDLSTSDEKQMRRVELNYYCEFYGLAKKLNVALDELSSVVTIAGQEKIYDFFKGVRSNTAKEITRQAVQKKIKQGHKRKSTKKTAD